MSRAQIRLLKGLAEFQECERIQKAVWGAVGVASELLIVTQKYGGIVLGAFVDGRCVGFLYSFLARRHGRLIHWSHQMAVRASFRDRGLGFQMKMAHRRYALHQGIDSICWTFDPLQSRNAALNIRRLGGQAEDYLPDCYGHFPSLIEKGLPSDRLVVNWRIGSAAVARRLRGERPTIDSARLPLVNHTRRAGRFLVNQSVSSGLRQPRLLVEIPTNTDAMRARRLDLARRWRIDTRTIFQKYFHAGYNVVDAVVPETNAGRFFYVLHRVGTSR